MQAKLGTIDIGILLMYSAILVGMGCYYIRKSKTAEEFMIAGRSIPAWAAGLAVMSAYTSSISYIAVPGMAFDNNWHPLIFVLCIPPVAFVICRFVVPYYRKFQIISVYGYLEEKLGVWARVYAALSFVIYMIGRAAVIIYLSAILLATFIPWNIAVLIILIGMITVIYTLLGGMEAVIWTDVFQSIIMFGGLIFCVILLTIDIFSGPDFLVRNALGQNKFGLGSLDFSLSSRTVWVMIIYGVSENLRNLIADQNYVQKYSAVADEKQAKKTVWIGMLLYVPLTPVFLYIGTALFAYYSNSSELADAGITKGDQVFPYFIATQLPVGVKGLIIAAILAAAMSTLSSAYNCSATVLYIDFLKRFFRPDVQEKDGVSFLRFVTVIWGVLSIFFAVLMIKASSALDIWWQISGVFGGGILGLFILGLLKVKLKLWQGLLTILSSILIISWITFARNLPDNFKWFESSIDPIIAGAFGVVLLVVVGLVMGRLNKQKQGVPVE